VALIEQSLNEIIVSVQPKAYGSLVCLSSPCLKSKKRLALKMF